MIALVERDRAREGFEFIYLGMAGECKGCRLEKPCHHNLEKGWRYVVKKVSDRAHPCRLFGEVLVCEVEEVLIEAALRPALAIEGATIIYEPVACPHKLCEHARLCMPEGLAQGVRCTVEKVKGRVECDVRGWLALALLRRV